MKKSCETCALNGRCNYISGQMFGYCNTRYLPNNKYYLIGIESPRGTTVTIGYYPNTPDRNWRIYYCGSDTGARYQHLGNASRRLHRYIQDWTNHGITDIHATYGTASTVQHRG
jgi:hypothetical protein